MAARSWRFKSSLPHQPSLKIQAKAVHRSGAAAKVDDSAKSTSDELRRQARGSPHGEPHVRSWRAAPRRVAVDFFFPPLLPAPTDTLSLFAADLAPVNVEARADHLIPGDGEVRPGVGCRRGVRSGP